MPLPRKLRDGDPLIVVPQKQPALRLRSLYGYDAEGCPCAYFGGGAFYVRLADCATVECLGDSASATASRQR